MGIRYFPDLVNGNDVGMVQGGGSARFLGKAFHPFGVSCKLAGKQFDGDLPPQSLVLGQVDIAHPS